MSIQRTEFLRFIKLLADNDCLKHVIVIGSWAEFIYKETSMMPGFEPNIKTLDVDFLIRNMRRPSPPKSITALAKAEGYLIDKDVINGTTKIMDRSGLEIEFLIGKIGAGEETAIDTNLGISAQSLRHMQLLLKNAVQVRYMGMKLYVPLPEAYALHKVIINGQRGRKQEKDRQAVMNLWPYLNREILNELYEKLSKKEKKVVDGFMQEQQLSIE